MKMPFGKYKGEDLEDLPTDYIDWLLTECDLLPDLEAELENQLKLRKGHGVSR